MNLCLVEDHVELENFELHSMQSMCVQLRSFKTLDLSFVVS